jgi:hypothetical protein
METPMNRLFMAAIGAALLMAFSGSAHAKGCIKGALSGGAAGHMAGHGKIGGVAGCVIGRHNANKRAQERAGNQNTGAQNPGVH